MIFESVSLKIYIFPYILMVDQEVFVRPSWDEYFMDLARTVAERSTCDR